eukprot:7381853-Ditylum_brightwellii.AAC.1
MYSVEYLPISGNHHVSNFISKEQAVAAPGPSMDINHHHKISTALHPDGLLSTLTPVEEVSVAGPFANIWVRRTLDVKELADAFDLSSKVTPPSAMYLERWARSPRLRVKRNQFQTKQSKQQLSWMM